MNNLTPKPLNQKKAQKLAALLIVALMLSSLVLIFSIPTVSSHTIASGDLLQYEYPQWYGSEHWDNFAAGPAPDAGDLAWRTRVQGASSVRYYPAAIHGYVFIYSGTTLTAVDGITGEIAWSKTYTLQLVCPISLMTTTWWQDGLCQSAQW